MKNCLCIGNFIADVVVKPDKGCFIATRDKEYKIPAYGVKVVSAVGPGDSFVAGFLTGIIKGWGLEESGFPQGVTVSEANARVVALRSREPQDRGITPMEGIPKGLS